MTEFNEPSRPRGGHYQPPLVTTLVILVVFVAGVFLLVRSPHVSSPTTTTTTQAAGSQTTTVKSSVTVQVANGTSVSNLAHRYTQQLTVDGWNALGAVNGPKVNSTVVYYNTNFQWAAAQIATSLGLSQSAVTALNGLSPVPNASNDDVIVIIGPNLAIAG